MELNEKQTEAWLIAIETAWTRIFEMLREEPAALAQIASGEASLLFEGGSEPGFAVLQPGQVDAEVLEELDGDRQWLAGALNHLGRFFDREVLERPKWRDQWFAGVYHLDLNYEGFKVKRSDGGSAGVVDFSFTDPGSGDTHTATCHWDGITHDLGTASPWSCDAPDTAGIYTVTVEVTDDDGGVGSATAEALVVVYDPSGGFVTGGGWIDSPAGALEDNSYELVWADGISWVDANAAANAATGGCPSHLVTITSPAEQAALYDLFGADLQGKWYGGFQPAGEPDPFANWQWVTGENWFYTNWADGEPNDAYGAGSEQHLLGWELGWTWNDEGSLGNVTGYVVEHENCLTGKATFGFVSKYKKGATVPTGNTEFQFHAAGLNFHSSSYDWLVVTGSDYARFKGVGTINGEGEYKFMIWAGDDDPDTFRIKIWTEDALGYETVVYDNGMDQALGGGSIVIHTK